MYSSIENYARQQIKEGLDKLKPECIKKFRMMYPEGIDKMPSDKLDWALFQVERSLKNPDMLKESEGSK